MFLLRWISLRKRVSLLHDRRRRFNDVTDHSLTDDGTSDNPSRLSDYRGPDNIEDYESCEGDKSKGHEFVTILSDFQTSFVAETTSDTHPEHDRRDPSLSDHPARFISIVWHPSSNRPDEIIPLSGNADQDAAIPPSSDADLLPPVHGDRLPWHPFDTKGDFKFVHFVTTNRLKNKAVDQLLEEMHENREWTSGCTLSFKTHKDIELVLSKARVLFPEVSLSCHSDNICHLFMNVQFQFRTEKISVKSGEYSFKFTLVLRNAWHWLESLVTDPIFASKINWYPCRKYLHEGDSCTRLYDDLETGDNWWDYQVHCPRRHFHSTNTLLAIRVTYRLQIVLNRSRDATFQFISGQTKPKYRINIPCTPSSCALVFSLQS